MVSKHFIQDFVNKVLTLYTVLMHWHKTVSRISIKKTIRNSLF